MARFLVIHSPREEDVAGGVRAPSRLADLARASRAAQGGARWLTTWSPDLGDDRIFSLWEAESANQIEATLERYGFLDDLDAHAIRVREWGPDDVLASED